MCMPLKNPIDFSRIILLPDDRLVIISRLGTLLTRLKENLWQFDALDADIDLLSYSENKSGQRVFEWRICEYILQT